MPAVLPHMVKFLPHEAALSLIGMPSDPSAALGRGAAFLLLTAWAGASIGAARASFSRHDA